MDCKSIGNVISELRRKNNMTQLDLAKRLEISDKAISKWETGQSYPDITLFPALSEIFGVTIDYLMMGERKGIAIAGNMLLDIVKTIDSYPQIGMLGNILDLSYAVGGCVPNTAIDLAKIDSTVPISAVGKLGMDENGRYISSTLQRNGIDISNISYSKDTPTSFSDVMSVRGGGERTFFHKRGANAEFSPSDIDLDKLNCNIFHIGYILLLDSFDAEDKKYGTVMARFLREVQKKGIKTSIDVVSASEAQFGEKIIPCLKYCNYVIINELECCAIWGLEARTPSGQLNRKNLELAMKKTVGAGVKDRVIVHCKECSFIIDSNENLTVVPSLRIPKEEIKGSVGAGDAFCAGSLYGIYNNYNDRQILEFASAAAACNLFAENSIDGMKTKQEILELADKYGRITL